MRTIISLCLLLFMQLTTGKANADTVVWNFTSGTAAAASSSSANVLAANCTASGGVTSTSASSGYAGASGTYNTGIIVSTGAFSATTSQYISFTVTPNSGYAVTITGISFGSRSTGTGPTAYTVSSDISGFSTALGTGSLSATSAWALNTPAFTSSSAGAASTPVTVRVYGYNSSGTSGAVNWRLDDITISYTANPTGGCSGTPAAGTVSPSLTNICGAGTPTLTLTGGTAAAGITYQWSSSATNTPPGSNISGANSTVYVPSVTATTYYWCTSTCTSSASSSISAVGTVSVTPLPVIGVTPTSGNICTGTTAGVNFTASGANTYSWNPSSGLSASTGASVNANPTAGVIYTVTGTALSGCQNTNTVTVNYYPTPTSLSITPVSTTSCAGGTPNLLTATGGLVGPTTVSSGTLNMTLTGTGLTTETPSLIIGGVPAGATITGISVALNASFNNYQTAYVFSLKSPNGKIINLIQGDGCTTTCTGAYTNTIISSTGTSSVNTGTAPFTGTFSPDASATAIPTGFVQTTTLFSDLWGTPNGTWTLAAYHNYSGVDPNGTLISWSITLTYSYQAPATWANTTNLFTDAAGTLAYTGTATNTVYQSPVSASVTTYTVTATNSGCSSTASVTTTVNALPTAITGANNVCAGSTITLSDGITGGTWTSSNTSVATIDAVTGIVSAITGGISTISYSNGCAPDVTSTVTVNVAPTAISGTFSICNGSNTTLSDAITGGTWSSSNTTVATIDPATGIMTGSNPGTATISYTTGCGTPVTANVTVISAPAAISGLSSVCAASGITLSDAVTGGTWTSSNTTIATINAATGVVSALTAGTTTISYTTGCGTDATFTVTVISAPAAISGTLSVCQGLTTTLSNTVTGGTWSSSSTIVATINSSTGVVTGSNPGTATISYTTGCGTPATALVTIIAAPTAITGVSSVCAGSGITLSDALTGGTWSSSATTVATINATTGAINGLLSGNTTISYNTGCGTPATAVITVIAAPAAITGASSVCAGSGITLSDAVSGGTWSSSNTSAATINAATGAINALLAGTTTISYVTGCGTPATLAVTVIAAPTAISGQSSVCVSSGITLSDAVTGGTWSSSSTSVATINATTGVIAALLAGNTTISYTTGCGTPVTSVITVIAAPAAISGLATVCTGSGISLSDAVTGGTWSSSATSVATINATTGALNGLTAGTTNISYTTGCGTPVTKTVTVLTAPDAITGAGSVCAGSTITLSDDITGGTWTSSSTTVASVNTNTGLVTAGIAGNTTITYATGCGTPTTLSLTVIAAPTAISGLATVCTGSGISLSDAVTGGTWSSSATSVATINATTGALNGLTAGTTNISYTTGCGTPVTKTVTVLTAPDAITGAGSVCAGSTITLSDDITGGTWTSSSTTVASVNTTTGLVTAGIAGNTTITYATGCGTPATKSITVIAIPAAITGVATMCFSDATTLSDAIAGGTWSSSNTGAATINAATGSVTSGLSGNTIISYTTGCGTPATHLISIITAPAAISDISSVCAGITTTLSDAVTGGTWSSTNTSVATIDASGLFTSGVAGTTTIGYTTGCGSPVTKTITVIGVPGAISGASSVCLGAATTLSNSVSGGTWSSANTALASIDANTGLVTGGIAGNTTITYTTGCGTNATAAIRSIAAPGLISGSTSVCVGSTTTLTNSVTGGTWSSNNTSIATINATTGLVSGILAGNTMIIYTTGCGTDVATTATVNPLPVAPAGITGLNTLCAGSGTIFSDATPAGSWSSSNTSIATIDAAGNLTALSSGNTTISYTAGNVCGNAMTTTIVTIEAPLPVPAAITGTTTLCELAVTNLSDITASGTWSSANTTVATIDATGTVTGLSGGNTTISYTTTNSCGSAFTTATVTINPLPAPAAITGNTGNFCAAGNLPLSDVTTGGTWSSNITTIATVDNNGIVTGVAGGSTTIFYSLTNSCGTVAASTIVTIDPLPIIGAVTGPVNVCVGNTISLSDTTVVGTWSSGASGIATISNSGFVTGLVAGIATVSYSVTNSCGTIAATSVITVSATPDAGVITGIDSVCPGFITTLSDAVANGAWSSDNHSIAAVNASGLVVGVSAGYDTIRYTVTNSCGMGIATKRIKVESPSSMFCNPTGVNNVVAEATELKIFPNPNSGVFMMELVSADNEAAHVIITNVVGEKVQEFTTVTNKETGVKISQPAGVYIISVTTANSRNMAKVTITN